MLHYVTLSLLGNVVKIIVNCTKTKKICPRNFYIVRVLNIFECYFLNAYFFFAFCIKRDLSKLFKKSPRLHRKLLILRIAAHFTHNIHSYYSLNSLHTYTSYIKYILRIWLGIILIENFSLAIPP